LIDDNTNFGFSKRNEIVGEIGGGWSHTCCCLVQMVFQKIKYKTPLNKNNRKKIKMKNVLD